MLTQFLNIYKAIGALPGEAFILDGEIVALDEAGRPSFTLLQNIRKNKSPVIFYMFDLLHQDGKHLLELPLRERRKRLEVAFPASSLPQHVRLSPVLTGSLDNIIAQVKRLELEGVIAKRLDSIYEPGKRSGAWQKHKTQPSDDFVIGGYSDGGNGRVDEIAVGTGSYCLLKQLKTALYLPRDVKCFGQSQTSRFLTANL